MTAGASVNIYMFYGGTNFGFSNGAADDGTYKPIVTSYDYDAALSRSSAIALKFLASSAEVTFNVRLEER